MNGKTSCIEVKDRPQAKLWTSLVQSFQQRKEENVPINDMEFRTPSSKSFSVASCLNTQQHGQCIPLNEASLEHLPQQFQNEKMYDFMQAMGELVVKVTVKATSMRVETGTPIPQTMSTLIRQGTGWICPLLDNDIPAPTECPCKNSKDKNHKVIGPFYIITARHVVFDNIEALNTSITFTDDFQKGVSWTAEGVSVVYTPEEDRDFIYVKCFSHHLDVFTHILSASERVFKASMALIENEDKDPLEKDYVFVISHPHNHGKYISFGHVLHKEEKEVQFDMQTGEKKSGIVLYSYDVNTCPGSSGAPVCIMGMDRARYYMFPHSRKIVEDNKSIGCSQGLVEWLIE